MKLKMKKDFSNSHCIRITRAIEVDDKLKNFIFSNSNYRRKVWNDFVQEYYRCKDNGEKFDVMEYKKWYYNNVEVPNHVYDTHTVGISEQVMKDIKNALKICKTQHGKLRFKKFDRHKCSFGMHTKVTWDYRRKYPHFNGRLYIGDNNFVMFRDHGYCEPICIKLKEPLFHDVRFIDNTAYFIDKHKNYGFSIEDIKEVSFIHELGRFYISLSIEVIPIYSKKREGRERVKFAGIDLGIHNPVSIWDGSKGISISMSKEELSRIAYLERRTKRLHSIMDRKQYGSKNYEKVRKKFRITWRKIRNIRLNWRRKLSKSIATTYKYVCVDGYRIPTEEDHETTSVVALRRINHHNRMHGMYLFNEALKHACWKYRTKYVESPENTTITCSNCGYINAPLLLSQRTLHCERCGISIDRDLNASKNCYDYLISMI